MPYTPPPPSAVDFKFSGDAYQRPETGAVDFDFGAEPPAVQPVTASIIGRIAQGLNGHIPARFVRMVLVQGALSGLRGHIPVLTIPDVDISGALSGLRGSIGIRHGVFADVAGALTGLRLAAPRPAATLCAADTTTITIQGSAVLAPLTAQPVAIGAEQVLPVLRGIGSINRALSIPGIAPAPTSSMDAALDNGSGQLTQAWASNPPIRQSAQVRYGGDVVFDGVVTGISLGAEARLQLESGHDRPLSDNVPLRTTAVWGGWRDVKTIPWAWGRVWLEPLQYSDDAQVFVLADHPIKNVLSVHRDDVPTEAYAWVNGVDSTGRAVAFLELAMPLSEGERLSAEVLGKMHPDTGAALQSPAEIAHDLLTSLGRVPVAWADFDDYRAETAGQRIGGVVADDGQSIRATVDGLMQATGSAWAASMPGVAMLWPPAQDDDAPALLVDKLTASDVQASAQAQGVATVVRVLYDYDYAAQRYTKAVQVRAPEAAKEWGVIELEWPAGWLRSPRDAEALGRRVLAQLARPRWRVTFALPFANVPTGAWVDMQHPLSPLQGRYRLTNAELDTDGALVRCEIEAPTGEVPEMVTERLSSAFDPLIQPGIAVDIGQGEIIFTALDEQGRPMAGAKITLDGKATRVADSGGKVSFPTERGRHILLIEAQGYPPSEVEVVI